MHRFQQRAIHLMYTLVYIRMHSENYERYNVRAARMCSENNECYNVGAARMRSENWRWYIVSKRCTYRVGYTERRVYLSPFCWIYRKFTYIQWKFFNGFLEILRIVGICSHFLVFLARHLDKAVRMTCAVVVMVLVFERYLCRRKTRQDYIVTTRGC